MYWKVLLALASIGMAAVLMKMFTRRDSDPKGSQTTMAPIIPVDAPINSMAYRPPTLSALDMKSNIIKHWNDRIAVYQWNFKSNRYIPPFIGALMMMPKEGILSLSQQDYIFKALEQYSNIILERDVNTMSMLDKAYHQLANEVLHEFKQAGYNVSKIEEVFAQFPALPPSSLVSFSIKNPNSKTTYRAIDICNCPINKQVI